MRVLVAYASTHGHTARIAERIGAVLRDAGIEVVLEDVRHDSAAAPENFVAAMVGGSIHMAKHHTELVNWIRDHRGELQARPSAFFSVSLSAAGDTGATDDAWRAAHELLDDTGWTPDATTCFAGALEYREYDAFTRVLMRLVARQHDLSTDTSADVDLTDWDAVDRFAADFAATLHGVERVPLPS
jgi:menaquinone-dependent protoporphyrinogen oxidase